MSYTLQTILKEISLLSELAVTVIFVLSFLLINEKYHVFEFLKIF